MSAAQSPQNVDHCFMGPAQRLSPQSEKLGIAWWNGLNKVERIFALKTAESKLLRPVSAAEAWVEWNAEQRRLLSHDLQPRRCVDDDQ